MPPRHNPGISNSHFRCINHRTSLLFQLIPPAIACKLVALNSTSNISHNSIIMGLFGSSAPSSIPAPKVSTDGTPIAPDRSARQKCWDARDTYFACLDKHGIVDSIRNKEEAEKACPREGDQLAGNCASSWVSLYSEILSLEEESRRLLKRWGGDATSRRRRRRAEMVARA